MELTLNNSNFEQEVLQAQVPVLVDFWASWCGPCRMLGPVIAEIAAEHTELKVGKVNVDDEEALAARYGVQSIPTLIFFKNGEEIYRSVGFQPKESVEAQIKKFF